MTALHEDEHFPASLDSVFYDGRADPGLEWQRPGEICSNPVFINEGATKFDIAQGHLSNCWFLSAAAVLATNTELFAEIIPAGQNFGDDYTGRFRFRFWRFGTWEEVDIDDRLPTKDGQLYFCHNRETPNEFWSALLEKAYAKVHRSYQALNLGYGQDALVDLTGGIGEFIDLHGSIGVKVAENETEKADNISKLFRRVKRLLRRNATFMCSAINVSTTDTFEGTRDNGLVAGHAYSILSVVELTVGDNTHQIMKLRNPWGWREWSGSWSDGSSDWEQVTEQQRGELGLTVQNEGEFWMPFEAWIENFDNLELCHLTPDSVHGSSGDSLWSSASYSGHWVPGVSAGGCSTNPASYWQNPQYFIRLRDPDDDGDNKCTLVVSLMQKYSRVKKTEEKTDDTEDAIGFDLFKYRGERPEELEGFVASQTALQIKSPMFDFEYFRERSKRFELSPGTYCIIPSTYSPNKDARFLLRLASERRADSGEVDTPSGQTTPSSTGDSRRFDRLFGQHSGADEVVDARELKRILNQGIKRAQDEEFSRETCRALVKSVVGDRMGTIDRDQCKDVWRQVKGFQESFDEFDRDQSGAMNISEIRRALRAAGYTLSRRTLTSIAQRYCGKSNQLSLDDYSLIATKITVTSEAFEEARRQSGSGDTVQLTMDQILEMAL